jgi:hypothetical protein
MVNGQMQNVVGMEYFELTILSQIYNHFVTKKARNNDVNINENVVLLL